MLRLSEPPPARVRALFSPDEQEAAIHLLEEDGGANLPFCESATVDVRGGLRIRSGAQRFYEGPVAFEFPLSFSGVANVCEWYDDAAGKFRIEVAVHNRRWGPLFGYRGSFDVEWRALAPARRPGRSFRSARNAASEHGMTVQQEFDRRKAGLAEVS